MEAVYFLMPLAPNAPPNPLHPPLRPAAQGVAIVAPALFHSVAHPGFVAFLLSHAEYLPFLENKPTRRASRACQHGSRLPPTARATG